MKSTKSFKLPNTLYSSDQLEFVLEEIERLIETERSEHIKQTLHPENSLVRLPALSIDLKALVSLNEQFGINDLKEISKIINNVKTQAVQLEFIVAAWPTEVFLEQLATWLRAEIHPHSFIRVTVRRGIAGGCVLKSANRIYDWSFRTRITESKGYIREVLARV